MPNFQHVNDWCFKKPCRNAHHWELLNTNGQVVKDTVKRIDAMRLVWHGRTD